jgi:hypothetical protein
MKLISWRVNLSIGLFAESNHQFFTNAFAVCSLFSWKGGGPEWDMFSQHVFLVSL